MIDVDFMILADDAQIINERLYLLGGGVNLLGLSSFPFTIPPLNAVFRFRVPWPDTDTLFTYSLEVLDPQGAPLAQRKPDTPLRATRSDHLPEGEDHYVADRVCFLNLTFQQPGPHPFVLSVNDRESKRLVLWVTTI